MYTLFEDGMNKVLAGVTSVKEITRMAKMPEDFTFRDRIDEEGDLMSFGQAKDARASSEVSTSAGRGRNTVLVVEDSKRIRSLVRFVLHAARGAANDCRFPPRRV